MKLNEPVNGSPVVTPLKISSVLGQKLSSKVEPANETQTHTSETTENGENDEEFDNFPEDDEDSVKDENVALTGLLKDKKIEGKLQQEHEEVSGGGGGGLVAAAATAGSMDNNDTAETEEESSSVGKKKGVRKKRSINWEEAERSLLVEVIKPKVDFVENKSVDAKSIKSKRMAWLHVTKQFNSLNFRHRSLEQIQVQWRSMKNSAKKEYQQKNPKSFIPLEGLQMLEFMEEMQKEPIMGGTRSQTRNSSIQNNIVKKEAHDDLEEDEEEDTPLAALPTILQNHSNSEDTQPTTSTLALASPPPTNTTTTSAELQNAEFHNHHQNHHQQQQLEELDHDFYDIDNIRAKKKRSLPKIKQKVIKTKSPLLAAKLQEKSNLGGSAGGAIGLKIKRQKCDNSTSSSSLTDGSTTGLILNATASSTNYHQINDSKPPLALTTPPPSPPACLDDKFKKQLFDLIKRSRLAEIDYARKEHEQKLRHEQQEQELKLRYMTEIHEQRMRFALQEHEARMRVYTVAKKSDGAISDNGKSVAPEI